MLPNAFRQLPPNQYLRLLALDQVAKDVVPCRCEAKHRKGCMACYPKALDLRAELDAVWAIVAGLLTELGEAREEAKASRRVTADLKKAAAEAGWAAERLRRAAFMHPRDQAKPGRKPFGEKDGEREVVDLILRLGKRKPNYTWIAERLNALGVRTRTGKNWRAQQVLNIYKRARLGGT